MLTKKAMLVTLSISQWTARKFDKVTTAEIDSVHGTDNAGRYNKLLIAQDAVKTVAQTATAARTFHYANTLPWNDQGARILPSANYLEYTQEINRLKAIFYTAVVTLVNNYPQLKDDARQSLKTLFNEDDYPDAYQVENKYSFSVSVDPIPDAADFRIDINADELKNLQTDVEERTMQAQTIAMRDLYDRLYNAVAHAADTLKNPTKIFRDTLIGNLAELADLLPRLNVAGDKKLDELTTAVKAKLANQTPGLLRNNPETRKEAAADAAAILETMAAYMGG